MKGIPTVKLARLVYRTIVGLNIVQLSILLMNVASNYEVENRKQSNSILYFNRIIFLL